MPSCGSSKCLPGPAPLNFFETGSHDKALAALELSTDQADHKLKRNPPVSASPVLVQVLCNLPVPLIFKDKGEPHFLDPDT